MIIADKNLLHTFNNHPVHIIDDRGKLSPSAFIPFCSFGDDFKTMSMTIENFSLPVCNSFRAVTHKDQVCYQVDLEKFRKKDTLKEQLSTGLVLIFDYNEDRSISSNIEKKHVNSWNV